MQVLIAKRGDLRRVRNADDLLPCRHVGQANTDLARGLAGNTGIHLVKNGGRHAILLVHDAFDGKHNARKLTARRYAHHGRQRLTGVGGDHEFHAVNTARTKLLFACDRNAKTHACHIQVGQLLCDLLCCFFCRLCTLFGHLQRNFHCLCVNIRDLRVVLLAKLVRALNLFKPCPGVFQECKHRIHAAAVFALELGDSFQPVLNFVKHGGGVVVQILGIRCDAVGQILDAIGKINQLLAHLGSIRNVSRKRIHGSCAALQQIGDRAVGACIG